MLPSCCSLHSQCHPSDPSLGSLIPSQWPCPFRLSLTHGSSSSWVGEAPAEFFGCVIHRLSGVSSSLLTLHFGHTMWNVDLFLFFFLLDLASRQFRRHPRPSLDRLHEVLSPYYFPGGTSKMFLWYQIVGRTYWHQMWVLTGLSTCAYHCVPQVLCHHTQNGSQCAIYSSGRGLVVLSTHTPAHIHGGSVLAHIQVKDQWDPFLYDLNYLLCFR